MESKSSEKMEVKVKLQCQRSATRSSQHISSQASHASPTHSLLLHWRLEQALEIDLGLDVRHHLITANGLVFGVLTT